MTEAVPTITSELLGPVACSWRDVESALVAHYHSPDLQAARALYAAIAAHRLKGQPVWPMIVAPPGSMKTDLLDALDGLPLVFRPHN